MTDKDTDKGTELDESMAILQIPAEHVDAVTAFVNSLTTEEAEVSGYSFSTPESIDSFGSPETRGAKITKLTGCVTTADVGDLICGDKGK